jgi:hypothetical protein
MGLTRPKAAQVARIPRHKDKKFYLSVVKTAAYLTACYALYQGGVVLGEAIYTELMPEASLGHWFTYAAGLFAVANIASFIRELS